MCQVDLASGRLNLSAEDFRLPGRIPLEMVRQYRSSTQTLGDLGYGWGHTFGVSLLEQDGGLMFRGGDGRRVPLTIPTLEEPAVHEGENVVVSRVDPSEVPWTRLRGECRAGLLAVDRVGNPTLLFDAESYRGSYAWRGIANRQGDLALITPGAADMPARIEDPERRVLHFVRGYGGVLSEILLEPADGSSGRISLVRYGLDANQDLVIVSDQAGNRTYEYHDHLLVRHADRCGGTCESIFDKQGRCVRTSGPNQTRQRSYVFDTEKMQTRVIDSIGNSTLYTFSPTEQISSTVDASGGVSCFQYDHLGRLTATIDQAGKETSLCYTTSGGVIKVDPVGAIRVVEGNPMGEPLRIQLGGGRFVELERDELGRVVACKRPGKPPVAIRFEDSGEVMTFPGGKEVRLEWNADRTVLTESDDQGILTEQRFDILGRILSLKDAVGAMTIYEYGSLGNLVGILSPDGSVRRLTHDAEGRLTSVTDERGFLTRWQHDAAGRARAVLLPDGNRMEFEYDTEDRLVAVRDLDGSEHTLEYDPRGLLIRQKFTDGRVERYGHDALGRMTTFGNPDGSELRVTRDPAGRMTQIVYPRDEAKNIELDEFGNWLQVTQGSQSISRELDEEGRITKESQNDFTIARTFDVWGKTSEMDSLGGVVAYSYDDIGRVSVVSDHEKRHEFQYDRVGNLVRWASPVGTVETCTYDLRRLVTRQRVEHAGRLVLERSYEYDASARLVTLRDSLSGDTHYSYDALGRLESWRNGDRAERVSYSSAGDLIRPGMQLARGHRVQFAGTSFLNYNECGEVVDRVSGQRRDQFTYDAQGLIEQAQMANGETIRFTYDPHSRLTSCQAGDRRVDYFWNGEQLSVIQDSTRGLIRFLSLPESYSPFEQIVAGRRFTLHRDRNGKVHTMIDEAGVIVWRVGLDPWVPSMDPQFPLGFPGQIADPVTGLFYNRYRFYNPESAQYLSSDPVGLWAAVDGYRYPQDPVNLIDPDGLKCRGKNDDPLVWKNAKRPPSVICKDGFKAINPNGTTSIADHVEGAVHDSPWISTTHRKDFAEKWMKSDGNQRYVYEIENPGCGVEVDCDPKLIAKYGTDPADSEHEIAFHKEIPVGKVKGYYPVGPGGVLGPFQSC